MDRKSVYLFVLQMICYLSIDEPQIEDSEMTKHTYRPSSKIRNRFSEVQAHDVGVRYGTSFRRQVKQYREAIESADAANPAPDDSDEKVKRKSPIPHFKSAHWQKFWVGKGRSRCEVRWIEPYFVGGSREVDAVIHTVH